MSQVTVRSVVYQIDGQPYEGRLAFDATHKGARPGLLMAPNWMGVSAGAEEIAKSVAAKGYVVLIADVYGQAVRPQNGDQAGAAMMPLKNDRALLRKRMQAAFEQLQKQGEAAVDTSKLAVFGFCFGGCCALDLARTGAAVKAAVSFHGTLDSPNPADAKNIKGSVLVPVIGLMYGGVLSAIAEFYAYRHNIMQSMQGWLLGDFPGWSRATTKSST